MNKKCCMENTPEKDKAELLRICAKLVTVFTSLCLCTARTASEIWRAIVREIGADDTALPPDPEWGAEIQASELKPDSEPMVTVVDSTDERLPVGTRLALSKANELVESLGQSDQRRAIQSVRIRIDYRKEGQPDCCWLPVQIGGESGSILDQMKLRLDAYRAHPERIAARFKRVPAKHREMLRGKLMPLIRQSLCEQRRELLDYFLWHCDVSEMEDRMREQAAGMNEYDKNAFLENAQETIFNLRTAANAPTESRKSKRKAVKKQSRQTALCRRLRWTSLHSPAFTARSNGILHGMLGRY